MLTRQVVCKCMLIVNRKQWPTQLLLLQLPSRSTYLSSYSSSSTAAVDVADVRQHLLQEGGSTLGCWLA